MQLSGPHWAGLRVRPDETVHESLVKPDSLVRGIKRDCELFCSGRAEVVAGASDCNHQCIVRDGAGRRDLLAFSVVACGEVNLAVRSVEADHFANAIAEIVIGSLRQVVNRITTDIHRASRDFV
jgi:hypothetical protein